MKHTAKQTKALWGSAQHWLENWENPAAAKIYGKACPCCKAFVKTSTPILEACGKCPIAQWSGQTMCDRTPWGTAKTARAMLMAEEVDEPLLTGLAREAFAREYRFLVCLALGEAPDPDLVED